jgi:hypothetical protein
MHVPWSGSIGGPATHADDGSWVPPLLESTTAVRSSVTASYKYFRHDTPELALLLVSVTMLTVPSLQFSMEKAQPAPHCSQKELVGLEGVRCRAHGGLAFAQ